MTNWAVKIRMRDEIKKSTSPLVTFKLPSQST